MWRSAAISSLSATALAVLSAPAFAATGLPAIADDYVSSQHPTATYGTVNYVKVASSPVRRTYLRFSVPAGPISGARLRIWVTTGSSGGFELRGAPDSWVESTLNYNNSPAPSATVTSRSGAFGSSQWVTVDATALVAPVAATGGNVSVVLTAPAGASGSQFASREAGAATAPQLEIDAGAASPPANATSPSISGIARQGETLTASPGTWNGTAPITYAYQWNRCDSLGGNCIDVPGQTAPTYPVTGDDVGGTLRVTVKATNAVGAASLASAPTAAVAGPLPPGDPVIAAAGDIACDPAQGIGSITCRQAATSDLLLARPYAAILTLGDEQYDCGGYSAFLARFDPTWGRARTLIAPAPGNHEYTTSGTGCSTVADAAGYFDYFNGVGAATGPAGDRTRGYYSFDIGSWHVVSLNGNCGPVGGCGAGSPQESWLRADLAAHPARCTLAYWHQPRFSSGEHGNNVGYSAFWNDLYASGVDVVLNAHDHEYERFAPQSPAAVPDPVGIREFVVGTGGKSQTPFMLVQPNSDARSSGVFGLLQLTLHSDAYDWSFVPIAGQSYVDTGTGSCH